MKRDSILVNDRQLACAYIHSQEGQDYLAGMAAAANFAWVNRSAITFTGILYITVGWVAKGERADGFGVAGGWVSWGGAK